jgi:uncharacterized protein
MPNRVSHFEIHATNPDELTKFYVAVFGWEIKKWEYPGLEYWMVMTGPQGAGDGINGGIVRRKGAAPAVGAAVNAFVSTIVVENYDEIAKKILLNGGREALPKAAIAGMAWQGYFKDPDGNLFGIHQPDPTAK